MVDRDRGREWVVYREGRRDGGMRRNGEGEGCICGHRVMVYTHTHTHTHTHT